MAESFRVLLVSESPNGRSAPGALLAGAACVAVTVSADPRGAARLLAEEPFDVVIVPIRDSGAGPEAWLGGLRDAAPGAAIVAVGDEPDDDRAVDWLTAGAADVLWGPELSRERLVRTIRYASARARRDAALEERRRSADERSADHHLDRLVGPVPAPVSADLYGGRPLRLAHPILFADLVDRYGAALDLSLAQQSHRVDHDVTGRLRELAQRLGRHGCGPRDVVDLHRESLLGRAAREDSARLHALAGEGRFLLVELMGHLVSYYRSHHASAPVDREAACLTPSG